MNMMKPRTLIFTFDLLIVTICCKRETVNTVPEQVNPPKLNAEQTLVIDSLVANMVGVEGGTFTMGATAEQGDDADEDEKTTHSVTLSSFSIGKFEVTQEEWEVVMGENPSRFKGAKRPVEQVSWEDCQKFIAILNALTGKNFRLPTEAEWEFAARGGNKSRHYKYSGGDDAGEVAWYDAFYVDDSSADYGSHPVGQKNPNELGLYDMSGNVWEWCQDWSSNDYYSKSPSVDPCNSTSASERVYRGGSWCNNAAGCRVSNRNGKAPDFKGSSLGLRLAY